MLLYSVQDNFMEKRELGVDINKTDGKNILLISLIINNNF